VRGLVEPETESRAEPHEQRDEERGTDDQRETTKKGVATFATVVPGGYQVAGWAPKMAHTFQWMQVGSGDGSAVRRRCRTRG